MPEAQPEAGILVKIVKHPDDPICPRISMGGTKDMGYYFVYRGELSDIKEIMDACQNALSAVMQKRDAEKH